MNGVAEGVGAVAEQIKAPGKIKKPTNCLARAVVSISDYIEAKGGTEEERIEAVEGLLQSIDDDDDGAVG